MPLGDEIFPRRNKTPTFFSPIRYCLFVKISNMFQVRAQETNKLDQITFFPHSSSRSQELDLLQSQRHAEFELRQLMMKSGALFFFLFNCLRNYILRKYCKSKEKGTMDLWMLSALSAIDGSELAERTDHRLH